MAHNNLREIQAKQQAISKATKVFSTKTLDESINEESKTKIRATVFPERVTFDTNLRMDNHDRNFLQAMASVGYASTQRGALKVMAGAYLDSLSDSERKTLETVIQTLEQRDARQKGNK
ncbi:DUF5388 domain-containing protein (plasmid) [Lacticaseibacillus paracasei]|uniref:DUF5388 domain-containing protein n=1 Tax=Lacticaseibacillus paracasei TaxID=1597 RepID=UPI0021B038EA|nr:DUF5388 domain-containing protein [Lacticaseibacillus paracasei]UWY26086.1 DUF5388 domain-containing protein [Lacticaseibacillus paracasei]